MGPTVKKYFHSKGNHQLKKKTTLRMEKNSCKGKYLQRIYVQHIQLAQLNIFFKNPIKN